MARIVGDDQDNELSGDERSDRISGLGGSDDLYGGAGADRLEGGDGRDDLYTSSFGALDDDDFASGDAGDDTLHGGYGADTLVGGEDDDLIYLDMTLEQFGDDTDRSADLIRGGEGFDSIVVRVGSNASSVDLGVAGKILVDGAVVARLSGVEAFSFNAKEPVRVIGSAFADIIEGSGGDDTVLSGLGDDAVFLGDGSDVAETGGGDDDVFVDADIADRVDLGAGDDTLRAAAFNAPAGERKGVYEGGDGTDVLTIDDDVEFDGVTLSIDGVVFAKVSGFESIALQGSRIEGLSGDDSIEGTEDNDRLVGNGGDDTIEAGDFDEGASDTISGGGGDDLVEIYAGGRDRVKGGAGEDRLEVLDAVGSLEMSGSTDEGILFQSGDGGRMFATGFESFSVRGTDGDDSLFGGALGDSFELESGADSLKAHDGDDRVTIQLDGARDRVDLGRGEDSSVIDARDDTNVFVRFDGSRLIASIDGDVVSTIAGLERVAVVAGTGDDRLIGSNLTDVLGGGAGRNVLRGEGGEDVLQIELDRRLDRIDGGDGHDRLQVLVDRDSGSAITTEVADDGTFTFSQNGRVVVEASSVEAIAIGDTEGDDLLIGQSGGDLLQSNVGDDTLIGGSGDDTLTVADGDDRISGGDGADTISFDLARTFDGVTLRLVEGGARATYADDVVEIDGMENVIGGYSHDRIDGDANDNVIDGGRAGSDTLDGGDGVDTLSFASRDDHGVDVTLAGPDDALASEGGVWIDVVRNFENVIGSDMSDTIRGDDGDNRIDGGSGFDVLAGGGGADVFAFETSRFANAVRIRDFSSFEGDRVDFKGLIEDLADDASLSFIGGDDFSGKAGEICYAAGGSQSKLLADLDGDGQADYTVILDGAIAFAERDLILG